MIKKLDWDSNFFGINVGRIDLLKGDVINIENLLAKYQKENYKLLYVFSEEPLNIDIQPIDIKVVYSISVVENMKSLEVLSEVKKATPQIYSLAYRSGNHSRFKLDKNIPIEKFEEFYTLWVDNSLSGEFADKVFKYEIDSKEAGFVTVTISDSVATIGLIAVDENFGRMGIGSKLINSTKRFAAYNACDEIRVATQLNNKEACAFYEKNGFSIYSKTYIYHLWQ